MWFWSCDGRDDDDDNDVDNNINSVVKKDNAKEEMIKENDLFEWEDPLRWYPYYDPTEDVKRVVVADGEGNVYETKKNLE